MSIIGAVKYLSNLMEPLSDVYTSENVDPHSLNEIRNGDVSERIETFEGRHDSSFYSMLSSC